MCLWGNNERLIISILKVKDKRAIKMTVSCRFCFLLLVVALSPDLATSVYEGYELISVTPSTKDHLAFLSNLMTHHDDLDFWKPPMLNVTSPVLVNFDLVVSFKTMMETQGIPWTISATDINGLINATYPTGKPASRASSYHTTYHDYDQIRAIMTDFSTQYPENIELSTLTQVTHEGREVMLVKLHGSTTGNKPAIIVEAGIHAREWISPAANLYVIEQLLQGYKAGSVQAVSMLEKFDWYFVPVTNPDGYSYTFTSSNNRLWRKNRRRISNRCTGVDLNRNFNIQFATTGVSTSCSSNLYPGFTPFSEPETANMKDLFESLKDRVVSYLSVHAYSQFVLVPWGSSEYVYRPDNAAELDRVAHLMSDAIRATHGKEYLVGTAWELLQYAASGAAEDWALSAKPGLYAICYELRPDAWSSVAFLLPPEEIIATGQEYLASLEVLAREMRV